MHLFHRHKGRWLQATNSSFWFEIMHDTVLLFCPHEPDVEHPFSFVNAARCLRAMFHDVRQWRDMTGMFVEMRVACAVHSYTWVVQSPEEQRAHFVAWDPEDSDVPPLAEDEA
jgi:hypothetical protein